MVSVEHWNEEAGQVWLSRLLDVYSSAIWLNPEPREYWDYTHSIQMVRELMADRMFPLTDKGLSIDGRLTASLSERLRTDATF